MIGIVGDDPPRLTDTQLLTSLGAGGVGFHTNGSFRRELIAYLVHVYIMRNQSRMESIYSILSLLVEQTFYLPHSRGGWVETRQILRLCERE